MGSFNFPAAPAVGDVHQVGAKAWAWNGAAWVSSGLLRASDAQLRARASHTGTQPIASVEGLRADLDSRLKVVAGAAALAALEQDNTANLNVGNLNTVSNTLVGYPAQGYNIKAGNAGDVLRFGGPDGACWIQYMGGGFRFGQSTNTPALGAVIAARSALTIDTLGNVLVTGSGGLGYGSGSGAQVIQATSKATAVTLNKPTGRVVTHNAALAANATVIFTLFNTAIAPTDVVLVSVDRQGLNATNNYRVSATVTSGSASIALENRASSALSEAVSLNFAVIKVAVN